MARPLPAWSSPAVGTLFSARHATTHASQPVQRSRSTTIPHLRAINFPGYRRQFWILDFRFWITNPRTVVGPRVFSDLDLYGTCTEFLSQSSYGSEIANPKSKIQNLLTSARPRTAFRAFLRQKGPVCPDPRAQSSPAWPPRRTLPFRPRSSERESEADLRHDGWRSGRNSRVPGPPAWRPRRARFRARRAPALEPSRAATRSRPRRPDGCPGALRFSD